MISVSGLSSLFKALRSSAKVVLCCLFISFGAGLQASAVDTLHLATALGYPYVSDEGKEGFLNLLMADVFARIGLQIEIIKMPGERSLINANKGIDDGDLLRAPGMERLFPNLIMVPESTMHYEYMAYTNLGSGIVVKDWNDLKHLQVGIINNWKILERNTTDVQSRIGVRTIELLFGLLKNKRTDAVIIDRFEGAFVSRKLGIPVKLQEPPLLVSPTHIYLNKRHRKLVPLISQALIATKQDGTYNRLLAQVLKAPSKLTPTKGGSMKQ